MTLLTRDWKDEKLWALSVTLDATGSRLYADWHVKVDGNWLAGQEISADLSVNQWNDIESSIMLHSNQIVLIVNGNQQPNPVNEETKGTRAGDLVDTVIQTIQAAYTGVYGLFLGNAMGGGGGAFQIRACILNTPNGEPELRRARRDAVSGIPRNRIREVSAMDFPDDGFVRYDFRNRLKKGANKEELTINFTLPAGIDSGLIWFAEDETSKSFVYVKVCS